MTEFDLSDLQVTCGACPYQIEGTVPGVGLLYFRFRWGHLTISIDPECVNAVRGRLIYEWSEPSGDALIGQMSREEADQHIREALSRL